MNKIITTFIYQLDYSQIFTLVYNIYLYSSLKILAAGILKLFVTAINSLPSTGKRLGGQKVLLF